MANLTLGDWAGVAAAGIATFVYIVRYFHSKGVYFFWPTIAAIVSFPHVADWLIRRSQRTPYSPITARDDPNEIYMQRWWLFNPYPAPGEYRRKGWRDWLPSIRVHHILRADDDGHMHDHPWDARTIVLRGWYAEERPLRSIGADDLQFNLVNITNYPGEREARGVTDSLVGSTRAVRFNSYHRICQVSPGGVYTLWFTWRYQGTWGFWVDGRKVPYREYLGLDS
jgi:hypothetical protein